MPRVDAKSAVFYLQRGALGIGEDHTNSDGRQLALDLIDMGVVKHLFLEIPYKKTAESGVKQLVYPNMINEAQRIFANPGKPANYFEMMQEVLEGIPEKKFAGAAPNRIPIRQVIARAIKKQIEVHCHDNWRGESTRKANYSNYVKRHSTLRKVFVQVTGVQPADANGGPSKGCLILGGYDHFTCKDNPIEHYILGLPYVVTPSPETDGGKMKMKTVRLEGTDLVKGRMKVGRLGP